MDAIGGTSGLWLWIGGWASSPEVWGQEIEAAYPGRGHAFLAAETLLGRTPEGLTEFVAREAGPGGRVLAWSLGSQLALEAWNAGDWPEGVGLVAVCPVVEFCAPAGPWRRAHLDRMIRGLGRDRGAVLEEFRKLLWDRMPEGLASRWSRAAADLPAEVLARGLERLRDGRLGGIRPGPGLVLVEGANDRVSPRLVAQVGEDTLAGLRCFELATGHVPFLEDPEGFGRILAAG